MRSFFGRLRSLQILVTSSGRKDEKAVGGSIMVTSSESSSCLLSVEKILRSLRISMVDKDQVIRVRERSRRRERSGDVR